MTIDEIRRRATIAARAMEDAPAGGTRPAVAPLQLASVFTFRDLGQVDRVYEGEERGYIYGRLGNPNVDALERAVAALEGAEAGMAAASGMAALWATVLAAVPPGGRLLASAGLYGGTEQLLHEDARRAGIEVFFVDARDPEAVGRALEGPGAAALLVETITNPLVRLVNVPRLARVARSRDALLLVDNTFASPALFCPLEAGADVVVHSATKYLGGHADLVAGVAAGPAEMMARARALLQRTGATLEPFSAWLTLRGLATLELRVRRQSDNALRLAGELAAHPVVKRTYYAGLPEDPDHGLARTMLPEGAGGMLTFELEGGEAAADAFLRGLRMLKLAPSLGDVMTAVSHPAKTSHRSLSPERRATLGIGPGLVRVSAGIEDYEDLRADAARGLAAATC